MDYTQPKTRTAKKKAAKKAAWKEGPTAVEFTPREPERIDRMLALLSEAWHLAPDWRLTQLVINASDTRHDCGPVFYLEDTEMEQRLKATVAALKNTQPHSP